MRDETGQPVPDSPSALSHGDFLQRALGAASEWTRFQDPKVLAVFIFLGLGAADLADHAWALVHARDEGNFGGWVATVAFFVGCGFAVVTVVFASFALFPRLIPQRRESNGPSSLYFFGGIASFDNPEAYEQAVREKTEAELEAEIARQAWELSRIALGKGEWARRAYVSVILFLAAWAAGRIALSFI
jgi:Pycsar effector protein